MSSAGTIRNHTVSKTLSIPLRFIGAQELMSTATDAYSGFLAKRGRRERIVERFNLPKKPMFNDIKKWRKRFIIISQGCVYIYDKETSSRPHQSFPLHGYNRLSKMGSDHDAFTFRIEGIRGSGFKMFYFSTETDEERKEWMSHIREVMCIANEKESNISPIDLESLSDDEAYRHLQQPVIDNDDFDDCDSDDSDYDKIEEEILEKHRKEKRPLPTVPEESKSSRTLPTTRDIRNSPNNRRRASIDEARRVIPPIPEDEDSKSSGSLPKKAMKIPRKKPEQPVAPKPKPQTALKPKSDSNYVNRNNTLKEKDFMFDSTDREEAKKILIKGPDGTFLVRNSRSDDAKVLAVKTDDEVREYKIFSQNSRVTLDKKEYYNSMQDLLKHYKDAKLPKRETTLGKAFSSLNLSE